MLILAKMLAKYFIIIYAFSSVIKSSVSGTKPFQSRSTVEIPGRARRKERLSLSKLKKALLTDLDAELFIYLIQCITFGSIHERNRVWTGPKIVVRI